MTETAPYTITPDSMDKLNPLEGTWRNELGSELVVMVDRAGGLTGTYRVATGAVAGVPFPVVGRYDPAPLGRAIVTAFSVDWTQVHSVTAWSGLYHPSDDTIRATWLMTVEKETEDLWTSTFVGQDVFRRQSAV